MQDLLEHQAGWGPDSNPTPSDLFAEVTDPNIRHIPNVSPPFCLGNCRFVRGVKRTLENLKIKIMMKTEIMVLRKPKIKITGHNSGLLHASAADFAIWENQDFGFPALTEAKLQGSKLRFLRSKLRCLNTPTN